MLRDIFTTQCWFKLKFIMGGVPSATPPAMGKSGALEVPWEQEFPEALMEDEVLYKALLLM